MPPRNTEELKNKEQQSNKRNLQEGDLVFFGSNRSTRKGSNTHVRHLSQKKWEIQFLFQLSSLEGGNRLNE